MLRWLFLSAALLASPAFAQQFNPDGSAYEITQRALSLAGYARHLEQQNEELTKKNAELQSRVELLKKQLDTVKAARPSVAAPDAKKP